MITLTKSKIVPISDIVWNTTTETLQGHIQLKFGKHVQIEVRKKVLGRILDLDMDQFYDAINDKLQDY